MLIKKRLNFEFLILFTIFSLVALHLFYFMTEISIIKSNVSMSAKKLAATIEEAIKSNNEVKMNEVLYILNDPVYTKLIFKSSVAGLLKVTPLGALDGIDRFDVLLKIPVTFNNLEIGKLEVNVNWLSLNLRVLKHYWWLYIANWLFLIMVVALTNKRLINLLRSLEHFLNSFQSTTTNLDLTANEKKMALDLLKVTTLKGKNFNQPEIERLINRTLELMESEGKLLANIEISKMTSQVSHDIRSPLAALNMIMEELTEIPEKNRIIIRSSVSRINDIANQLLEKGKAQKVEDHSDSNQMKLSIELLSPLIDSLISLKRVQFREKQGVEIESDINLGYGLFAKINPTELHRTLSNILNNSIEAMPLSKGKVSVSLKSDQKNIFLIVKDNGKGIPAHILAKLGEMGVSHGKEGTQSGSGLGIYHAKKTIESFGGKFEISSFENQGTTITMTFPKTLAPKWFVEKLSISPETEVVSLDDDLSIHQIWKGRFESMNSTINHLTFTSGIEFKNFVNQENKKRIYLVDFELLNQNQTGLEIISELNIGPQSILVTSRYEEESIRKACEKLGVKLIPKTMSGFVPIEIERPKKLIDIILIDDDELIHLVWQSQAKKLNKSFIDFYSFDDFLKGYQEFDLDSTIYIDSNLKNGVKGEEVSKIAYEELGFKNIYLCTGFEASSFPAMPWIKGIMGKELKF